MINLLITAALIWIVFVAAYRIIDLSGANVSFKNKTLHSYFSFSYDTLGERPEKSEYIRLAAAALFLRIGIYLLSALFLCFFKHDSQPFTLQYVIGQWHQWDASNYIRIATGGYRYHLENGQPTTLVFFPLYSCFIKLFYFIVRDYDLSAMIVSTLSFVGGVCYLYAFVSEDYGKETARRTVLYLSIFPFSFFYGAMMPESIFLLTSCAFLYYTKRHNWAMVALFGYLSSLARIQGILLIIPAGIEWLVTYKPIRLLIEKKSKQFFQSLLVLLPILASIAGTLTYFLINYIISGNWFKFMELQHTVWHHQYEYAGTAIQKIVTFTTSGQYDANTVAVLWLPQAVISLATIALLVYAVNKHKPQYTLYLAAYTVVSFSASFILSGGRYMSVAVPLFIILAKMLENRRILHILFVIFSSMLLAIYMTGYTLGYQIM